MTRADADAPVSGRLRAAGLRRGRGDRAPSTTHLVDATRVAPRPRLRVRVRRRRQPRRLARAPARPPRRRPPGHGGQPVAQPRPPGRRHRRPRPRARGRRGRRHGHRRPGPARPSACECCHCGSRASTSSTPSAHSRQDTWFKRTSASAFYWLLDHVSDVEIPRDVGDFRLMDRRVVAEVAALPRARPVPARHRRTASASGRRRFSTTGARGRRDVGLPAARDAPSWPPADCSASRRPR